MISRSKTTYKLVGLATGLLGGALASALFKTAWGRLSGGESRDIPEPTTLERDIREVLLVATLQGAVTGLIRAALARITEHGYRRFTANQEEP